jgi:hypothetical protein
MRLPWIASGALVSLATLATVPALRTSRASTAANQQINTPCSGTVSGSTHPELVPSYYAWEQFFARVGAPDSTILHSAGLEPSFADLVKRRAAEALPRAAAVRAAPQASLALERDSVAAQSILTARDDLIRTNPPGVFDSLAELVSQRSRDLLYPIAAPGKPVVSGRAVKCRVDVKGRDYPHLIPEFDYWEFYFRVYTIASESYLSGTDDYLPEYLSAVQRGRLPLPTEDLKRFLNLARETTRHVIAAREAGSNNATIAPIVLRARAQLIRSLSATTWTLIQEDAHRTRAGEIFTFPPS